MRETQTKTIDGHTYQVQMLPGTKSWKMMLRLSKMVGPSLGKVIDGSGGDLQKLLNTNMADVMLGEAIAALTERLDEADVELMVQQLAACTLVDNKPLTDCFELHFQGDGVGVVKWLAFALKANFGPFSDVLASAKSDQSQAEPGQQA